MSPRSRPATRLLADTRGASMVEYALLLFLVLVVAFVAFQTLGKSVRKGADMATVTFMS